MADITVRNQGEISGGGKVNWRGDQVTVPKEQGVYKTSTIQLAQLGSRKVVGDRVFRYAKAIKPILKNQAVAQIGSAGTGVGSIILATSCTGGAGSRVVTLHNPATLLAANEYAEGYLLHETGADHTSGGHLYRIKSHPAIAVSNSGTAVLYDELATTLTVTDTCTVFQNAYFQVGSATADNNVVGFAPVSCTTGDFLWLQTWGPGGIMGASALTAGMPITLAASGQVSAANTLAGIGAIGRMMGPCIGISRNGVAFIEIAP